MMNGMLRWAMCVLSSTSPQSSICWTELKKRLLLVLKKVSYSFWLRDTATQHRERSNHRCIDSSMICFAPGQFRGEIILEIFFCCALFHKDSYYRFLGTVATSGVSSSFFSNSHASQQTQRHQDKSGFPPLADQEVNILSVPSTLHYDEEG